jgi:hypothetical protein
MAPKKKASKNKPKKSSAKARQKPKAKKSTRKKSKKLLRKSPRSSPAGRNEAAAMAKGHGSRTAGQSGDIEGLSDAESVDSESVEELVEEGQDFEAELVGAVENAPEPDEGELDAEIPEDDQDPDVRSFSKRNRL